MLYLFELSQTAFVLYVSGYTKRLCVIFVWLEFMKLLYVTVT